MKAAIRSKLGTIKKKTKMCVNAAFDQFMKLMRKALTHLPSLPSPRPSTPPLCELLSSRQLKTVPRRQHRSPLKIFLSTKRRATSPRKFRRLFKPISPGSLRSPDSVPALRLTPEGFESEDKEPGERQHWLLLENTVNDCFLNAALQYMRRARDLSELLENRRVPMIQNDDQENKELVLRMLSDLLRIGGRVNPRAFREALPAVIRDLEPEFLTEQQDAYEILTKMFDHLIPEEIARQFYIESSRRRRCRDVENCQGCEQVDDGPIHYQHVARNHQVLNLEALLSSEWTSVEEENELRHCSSCCECCREGSKGHDEDKCEVCKGDKRAYTEEQRFRYQGTSNYALIAFNILHETERVDWALSETCDLDGIRLMGHQWKAVSVIKHVGIARTSLSHYVAYTREDDGLWWLHDDDRYPISIGSRYRFRGSHRYPYGTTDMHGVLAILFEKIV